jgi:hypothetical protein
MTNPALEPSGLTVDGVSVPQSVEGEGHEAVAAFIAGTVPVAPESPANPPTHAEGDE